IENVVGSNTAANTLVGDLSNNHLTGGAAGDNISGGAGNDTLEGNGGNDTIAGGLGDDSLAGSAGNETYVFGDNWGHDLVDEPAGGGIDKLDLSAVTAPLTIQLGSITVADGIGDSLFYPGNDIESIASGSGPDTLIGKDVPNNWQLTDINQGVVGPL